MAAARISEMKTVYSYFHLSQFRAHDLLVWVNSWWLPVCETVQTLLFSVDAFTGGELLCLTTCLLLLHSAASDSKHFAWVVCLFCSMYDATRLALMILKFYLILCCFFICNLNLIIASLVKIKFDLKKSCSKTDFEGKFFYIQK